MALIPYLPIAVPLLGAVLCLAGSGGAASSILRRWLYVSLVALTGATVLWVGLRGEDWLLSASPQAPYLPTPLAFLWTPLGLSASACLFLVLLVGQIPRLHRPLPAASAALRLVLLAGSLALMAAGNLLSLCLAWGVHLPVLLLLRATWRGSAAERPDPLALWISLASTACLLLGSVAVVAHQEGALFLVEVPPGLALDALALGVAMRLFGWPRVGGLRRNFEVYLMSLVTGFYLWLRVGLSLEATGPLLRSATGPALLLAVLGLVASFYRTPARALPYVLAHWLLVGLLAPYIEPRAGFAASTLVALNLALGLLALRVYQTSAISSQPLGRVLYLFTWASLGGLPFTPGFVAHWLLMRGLWQMSAAAAAFWVLCSLTAKAIPAWSQVRLGTDELAAEDQAAALTRPALYGLAAVCAFLLAVGLYPALLDRILWRTKLDLAMLHHGQLWQGIGGPLGLVLGATILGPLTASVTLHERFAQSRGISLLAVYRARRVLNVEWLSLVARERLDRLLAALGHAFQVLEGPFSLGWLLLWGVALIYFLVGG